MPSKGMSPKPNNTLGHIGTWCLPGKKFLYEKTVLVKQTNLFGNAYFSNFVEWQGEAREKLFLSHPASLEFLRVNRNVLLVTHTVHHRFLSHAFFGDTIRIELTTRDIMDYTLTLVFRYYNGANNELIGEGWQKICFFDTDCNQPCKVPQIFLDLAVPIRE
jgi:enediyne biosynthesis thioesterase